MDQIKIINEYESIKKFTENFFINLKCDVNWDHDILRIEKVPENFEKQFGKKSPYLLVFDRNALDKIENSELIIKGSSMFKVMANYLSNKAENTLLKMDFNIDPKTELLKYFNFNNFDLGNIDKNYKNDYIYRFTFITNIQYLNEREQIINTIYVHDKSIVTNFKIEDYKTEDGKKSEVSFDLLKDQYHIAKEHLKSITSGKISEVTDLLNDSLDKEINRVVQHYSSLSKEIENEIEKNENSISELFEKFKRVNVEEKKIFEDRINKLKIANEKLMKSEEKEKLEKEKEFFITDEKHKHALSINNSLINTTIIYYPIFSYKFKLKKNNLQTREIDLSLNPLTKQMSELNCDSCNTRVREINSCASGHISCKACLKKCILCGNEFCKACKKFKCSVCSRDICSKCNKQCTKCLKPTCKSDICTDYITKRELCRNCAKFCTICSKFTDSTNFTRCSSCGNEVCIRCSKSNINGKNTLCLKCSRKRGFFY